MSETDELKEIIAELEAERDALKQKVAHLDKLADLYPISLGNACDDRDKLKHSDRALRKENAALRNALENLVERLDLVHADSRYQGVWQSYQAHWGSYTGPKYENQLNAARAALSNEPLGQSSPDGERAGKNTAIAHEDIEDREQPDKWR